jgi:hypothetical protein
MKDYTPRLFRLLLVFVLGSVGISLLALSKLQFTTGSPHDYDQVPVPVPVQPVEVPSNENDGAMHSSQVRSSSLPSDAYAYEEGLRPVPPRHISLSNFNSTRIDFCRRCKRANAENNRSCVDEILDHVGEHVFHWPDLFRSIIHIANSNEMCGLRCNPKQPSPYCPRLVRTTHNMLGLDQVSPQVLRSTSHILPSLPLAALDQRFNPDAKLKNWTGTRALYTYNPTILPYSPDTYVATFRVATHYWLPDDEFKNYLGVAILDLNLKILCNVVVELNKHMRMGIKYKRANKRRDDLGFVDFRLFFLNGTYLLSDNIFALPISIIIVDNKENNGISENQTSLPLVYGDGIRIVPHGDVRSIENLRVGRNYNFVQLQDEIFVEEWPLPRLSGGGRETSRLEFGALLQDSPHYRLSGQIQGIDRPEPALEGQELLFVQSPWKYSNNRGTTCCIMLEREYYADLTGNETLLAHDYLLLGIAHVKSFKKLPMSNGDSSYGYLHRFYASLPIIPPTQTAAQSGLFCWPPASASPSRLLQWMNHTYNCPPITFASGMTVSLADSSKLIVAYGIDDEISYMVEISKRDVALRLFSPIPVLRAE